MRERPAAYGAGWIFKLKLADPAELDGLLEEADAALKARRYRTAISKEIGRASCRERV